MKISDLRTKDTKDLNKLLAQERNELRELRFKVASKQIKNYKEIKDRRKNIAIIKTVMTEKLLDKDTAGINNTNKDKE